MTKHRKHKRGGDNSLFTQPQSNSDSLTDKAKGIFDSASSSVSNAYTSASESVSNALDKAKQSLGIDSSTQSPTMSTASFTPLTGGKSRRHKKGGFKSFTPSSGLAAFAAPFSGLTAQAHNWVGGKTRRHRKHKHTKTCRHRKHKHTKYCKHH